MKRALILCIALAACGTPQQQCIGGVTRDLRIIDRLIIETQGNLDRGYGYREQTVYRTVRVPCDFGPIRRDGKRGYRRMCLEQEPDTIRRPTAIDLTAEKSKLDGLLRKRAQLDRQVRPAIAQCQQQYPE